MGDGDFQPHTESTTLNRSPKNLPQVLTSATPYSCTKFGARLSTAGFWANGWNRTEFFLFIYAPFTGTHLQVRRVDGFSRMMAQTTRTRARMYLFGVSLIWLPIYGLKSPKTPILVAWIGVFKPNSRNRKTCILSQELIRRWDSERELLRSAPGSYIWIRWNNAK